MAHETEKENFLKALRDYKQAIEDCKDEEIEKPPETAKWYDNLISKLSNAKTIALEKKKEYANSFKPKTKIIVNRHIFKAIEYFRMYELPHKFLEALEKNTCFIGVAHYRDPDFKYKMKEKDYQDLLEQLPKAARELKRQRQEDLAATNHYIDVVAGLQIVES